MTDLETLLNLNQAPAVQKHLSTRILTAAEAAEPANDTTSRRPWWSLGGIAAMAAMATIFFVQPGTDPAADWQQIADGSGFSDLYEWVEDEDS